MGSSWFQLIAVLITGVSFALSFPTIINDFKFPNLSFLAWFSLIPLYVSVRNASLKRTFIVSFMSGLIGNILSQYWLFTALHGFARYPLNLTIFVLSLVFIIVALYFALPFVASRFFERSAKISPIITLPVFFILSEFCLNYFPFNGFPWANLAYSQGGNLPIIQIANITGVYGVLFLIIIVNATIGETLNSLVERKKFNYIGCAVTFFLVAFTVIYGKSELKNSEYSENKLNVALIHGSREVPAGSERAASDEIKIVNERLSVEAVANGAQLILWPETSFFGAFRKAKYLPIEVQPFGVPLVIGGITFGKDDYYNSAFFVDGNGEIKSIYDKTHLVPLGEYVPLGKSVFKFLRVSNKKHLNFIPGKKGVLFEDSSLHDFKFSVMICYEDLFPEIARGATKNGASFLSVLVSDSWFEYSSAKLQHFNFSIFRAVENRRFVVRSANKGITGIIDPFGRVLAREDRFDEALIQKDIYPTLKSSIYTKYGDWFSYLCLGIAIGNIAWLIKRKEWRQNI